MAKTYTLTEAADQLEADVKTLRRWIELEKWDLSKQTNKYDQRTKWLTEEQISQLAKLHDRAWPPRPKSAKDLEREATGLTGAVGLLRSKVAVLEEDHVSAAQWRETVTDLYKRLESVENKYGELLIKHGDVLLKVQELEQAKRPGRKPKAQGEAQAQAED